MTCGSWALMSGNPLELPLLGKIVDQREYCIFAKIEISATVKEMRDLGVVVVPTTFSCTYPLCLLQKTRGFWGMKVDQNLN